MCLRNLEIREIGRVGLGTDHRVWCTFGGFIKVPKLRRCNRSLLSRLMPNTLRGACYLRIQSRFRLLAFVLDHTLLPLVSLLDSQYRLLPFLPLHSSLLLFICLDLPMEPGVICISTFCVDPLAASGKHSIHSPSFRTSFPHLGFCWRPED